jgi:hypothetical protein
MRTVTALIGMAGLVGCAKLIPDITIDARVPSPIAAPDGKALMVFFQPEDRLMRANVMDTEGRFITNVAPGTFVGISMDPGAHDLVVFLTPKIARLLKTKLTAGRVHFVGIDAQSGWWGPSLDVHVGRAASDLEGLKAVMPADVERAQIVMHDTWDVRGVIDRATRSYDEASAAERVAFTIDD